MSHEYEEVRRVGYDFGDGDLDLGTAVFVPVCRCGRFVKAGNVKANGLGEIIGPNAECSRCGPTEMIFEGWF